MRDKRGMTTGQMVRARREELRISARHAAALGGISNTAWLNLEKDVVVAVVVTQRAVAKALRWPRHWFDIASGGEMPDSYEDDNEIPRHSEDLHQVLDRIAAIGAEIAGLKATISEQAGESAGLRVELDELRAVLSRLERELQKRSPGAPGTPPDSHQGLL